MLSLCPAQVSRQHRDINRTKFLSSRASEFNRECQCDGLIVKMAPNIPLPVKLCLCKVTLEFLSNKVESVSHAMNLGYLVIGLGQENVAVPSLGLRRSGVLTLSLLEACHVTKGYMEHSQDQPNPGQISRIAQMTQIHEQ